MFTIHYNNIILKYARKFGRILGLNRLIRPLFYTNNEEKIKKKIYENISQGDIVWDVGANIGAYTEVFSQKVGKDGKVYAFEPHPDAYEILSTNISTDNVFLIKKALHSLNTKIFFTTNRSITTNGIANSKNEMGAICIEAVTGDNIIASGQAEMPNVVKIDVEGFEYNVLEGLTEALANDTIRFILIELHFISPGRINEDVDVNIISFLKQFNFSCDWLDPSHICASR